MRPGDTIRTVAEACELRTLASKADRGHLTLAYEVVNKDRKRVMSFLCTHILRCTRPTRVGALQHDHLIPAAMMHGSSAPRPCRRRLRNHKLTIP